MHRFDSYTAASDRLLAERARCDHCDLTMDETTLASNGELVHPDCFGVYESELMTYRRDKMLDEQADWGSRL